MGIPGLLLLSIGLIVLIGTVSIVSFNVIKNFYLVSKEFSDIVKLSFIKYYSKVW